VKRERDALVLAETMVTEEMIKAGIQAFREWERRFTDPDEPYPFYDPELRAVVSSVFLAMTEEARIAS